MLLVSDKKQQNGQCHAAVRHHTFVGRLLCIFQRATDTTFYILAVYFDSVGIRHTRHAIMAGLLTSICGTIAAIMVAAIFFG